MIDKKRVWGISILFAIQTAVTINAFHKLKSVNDELAVNLDNTRTKLIKAIEENGKYEFADTITTSTALVNNNSLIRSLSIQEKAEIALRFFNTLLKQENSQTKNLCNVQFEDNKIVNTFSLKDNLYNSACSKLYSCSPAVLAGIKVMENDPVRKTIPTTPYNAWVAELVFKTTQGISAKEGKNMAEKTLNLLKRENAVKSTLIISGNLLGRHNKIIQDELVNVRK